MRKIQIATIPVDNFADKQNVLECYFQYDRRSGRTGYFLSWLPLERDQFGGVGFSIGMLVNCPLRLVYPAKRFSQKRFDELSKQIVTEILTEGGELRSAVRDDYEDICARCCPDWQLPHFEIAYLNFKSAGVLR